MKLSLFPFPTLPTACSYSFATSARVCFERAIHTCINCFFHLLHLLLPCLFVASAGVFKNELIAWIYCWLVLFCYFFQFSSLAIVCLFAFITSAGVFLERAIHACIIYWSHPKFFPFCSLPVVFFFLTNYVLTRAHLLNGYTWITRLLSVLISFNSLL